MAALQLNPPIELSTPKGVGQCHFLVDNGTEASSLWVVIQEDGQIWWWPNSQVRGVRNFSMGRPDPEKPYPIPAVEAYRKKSRK